MSKNLIKQPAICAALIATGSITPVQGRHSHKANTAMQLAESQAAAIAARRKELGVKPVVNKAVATKQQVFHYATTTDELADCAANSMANHGINMEAEAANAEVNGYEVFDAATVASWTAT